MFKNIKQISLISFLIFVFLLPFNITESNIFWFLSVAFTLIDKEMYKNFSFKKLGKGEKFYIFAANVYLFWCIVSLLWSDEIGRGLQLIGRYFLIVAFSWHILFFKAAGILRNYKQPFAAFVAGVLVSSIVCLVLSYKNCWQETANGIVFSSTILNIDWSYSNAYDSITAGYNHFSYNYLSHFFHPSYFALYILFALIIMLSELHTIKNNIYKIGICFFSLYLLGFIFLLQSRANLVAVVIVAVIFVIFYSIIEKKFFVLIVGMVVISLMSVKLVQSSRLSWIFTNLVEAFNGNSEQRKEKIEKDNDRIIIWENAIQVIKQHPILGVGIGDTDTELENQYKKNGVDFRFGTHNQYIYAQLSMGVIGLLLLLAMFFPAFYYGIKNRYFPLIGFAVAVMVNLLFENMLTRNAGLMFIPWAMMLLLMMSEEKKTELAK
ncbi:MAG: O-antigen ligase family protein [Bacteroidales bacterium]|nr:O-antigen ligase family protein [Bacteroidales bacterium]